MCRHYSEFDPLTKAFIWHKFSIEHIHAARQITIIQPLLKHSHSRKQIGSLNYIVHVVVRPRQQNTQPGDNFSPICTLDLVGLGSYTIISILPTLEKYAVVFNHQINTLRPENNGRYYADISKSVCLHTLRACQINMNSLFYELNCQ